MYSREHLATSLATGLALLPVVETPLGPVGTVAYAGLLGTFVDLDHFLLARVRTGSWAPVRRALRRPRRLVIDQDELFEAGEVGSRARLASHVGIAGLIVAGFLATSPSMAIVTAVVLCVHVGADVVWDAIRAGDRATSKDTARTDADG